MTGAPFSFFCPLLYDTSLWYGILFQSTKHYRMLGDLQENLVIIVPKESGILSIIYCPYLLFRTLTSCKSKITSALDSRSQTHYPRMFVYINMVDCGKTRNEAHRIDLKNVELLWRLIHVQSTVLWLQYM